MDLRSSLDKILQMGAGEEIAQVYEFTVILVLDYLLLVR